MCVLHQKPSRFFVFMHPTAATRKKNYFYDRKNFLAVAATLKLTLGGIKIVVNMQTKDLQQGASLQRTFSTLWLQLAVTQTNIKGPMNLGSQNSATQNQIDEILIMNKTVITIFRIVLIQWEIYSLNAKFMKTESFYGGKFVSS